MNRVKQPRRKVGEVLTWDFQSDVFEGEYRLVEKVKGQPRTWVVEELSPSEALKERIRAYFAGLAPDSWEAQNRSAEGEIAEREARAGEQHTIKFATRDEWDRMF